MSNKAKQVSTAIAEAALGRRAFLFLGAVLTLAPKVASAKRQGEPLLEVKGWIARPEDLIGPKTSA